MNYYRWMCKGSLRGPWATEDPSDRGVYCTTSEPVWIFSQPFPAWRFWLERLQHYDSPALEMYHIIPGKILRQCKEPAAEYVIEDYTLVRRVAEAARLQITWMCDTLKDDFNNSVPFTGILWNSKHIIHASLLGVSEMMLYEVWDDLADGDDL